jgi:hypothetical protein
MPGRIMEDPCRYAGRDALMREAYNYLANGRSLFVTGRRGVGKSSFSQQLRNLLTKSEAAENRFAINGSAALNDVLNVTYRCTGTETLQEFGERMVANLLRVSQIGSAASKSTDTFKVNLKLFGYEHKDERSAPPATFINRLSDVLVEWFDAAGYHGRVVFWIDEVDLMIDQFNLAVFLKVLLENLADAHVPNVSVVLTGIGLERLKAQHPSISRFLVPVYVSPMSETELNEILERALQPTTVSFERPVCEMMLVMSQGFPDPVQSLGYELFEAAMANPHLVATAATFEGVLRKLATVIKREELDSIRVRIPDHDSERLLFAVARTPAEFSTIAVLSGRLDWAEERSRKVCDALCSLNFLESGGRNGYRMADPLFGVYLKIIQTQQEAEARRAEIAAQISTQLAPKSADAAHGMFAVETEKILMHTIAKNYRTTGHSGLGPQN